MSEDSVSNAEYIAISAIPPAADDEHSMSREPLISTRAFVYDPEKADAHNEAEELYSSKHPSQFGGKRCCFGFYRLPAHLIMWSEM